MPATAADLGVRDATDPAENIVAGARFLKRLVIRYHGDLTLALAAYHAGPGRVDAFGGVPPFPATRAYVDQVLWVLGTDSDPSTPAD
jgi:soluble lytic murein transglycosylase-like protein